MSRSRTSETKPAAIPSSEVEIYTLERFAEFFLNNAMDGDDYLAARKEVESMGLDPDTIDHRHSTA
jgi:hypothetical protein